MTVKDRKRTFASNLTAGYRLGLGPSGLRDPATDEDDHVVRFYASGETPEEPSVTYWVTSEFLDEGSIFGSTTSVQMASLLTPKAYLDESSKTAILVFLQHAASGSWASGEGWGSAPGTGGVSTTLSRSSALRSAGSFEDLFTYFSYLAEAAEPETVAQPHQETVEWIKVATGLSWERVGRLVGVTRQAVNAWRQGGPIADEHRRRLLEARDVLERAAERNPRPGGLAAWLDTPRGADARTPADLLEAGEAGKARLLALSSPSRGVKTPPEWARREAREAYLNSRERVRALPPEEDERLLDEASEDEDD